MDATERLAAQQARKALERLTLWALFLIPLLMNPVGQSLCGRIKVAGLWAAAGCAGFFLTRFQRSPITARLRWPAVLWMLATAVSVVTAISRVSSLWAAANILPGIVMAIAFATVARRAGARRRLIVALVASAGITSAYAVAQHYGLEVFHWTSVNPLKRAAGTVGAPTYLGAFLAMALPFAVALSRTRKPPRWLEPSIALMLVALAISYSRASWLAAATGIVVTMYAAGRAQSKPTKRELASIAMIVVIALPIVWLKSPMAAAALAAPLGAYVIWWLGSLPGFGRARRAVIIGLAVSALAVFVDARRPETGSWSRITTATSHDSEAASTRRNLWQVASWLIAHRPMVGYGPDGFRIAATAIAHDTVNTPEALLFPHQSPHSEWYNAAVEGGVLGLLAWTVLILSIASLASDRARLELGLLNRKGEPAPEAHKCPTAFRRVDVAGAVFGGVAAFVIQGSLTPRAPTTTLCLALCWGLAAAMEPVKQATRTPAFAYRLAGYGWVTAALLAAVSTLSADLINGRAMALGAQGHPVAALTYYRLAAHVNPSEPGYRRVWAESALALAANKQGMEAMSLAEDAYDAYSESLGAEPTNGIWRAGLAESLCFLNPREAVVQARQSVEEARASSTTWLALSRAYRASGNAYGEAYSLKAAISFDPVDPAAYWRLASIFRDENRPDLSERIMGIAADTYLDNPALAPWRGRGLSK